MLSTRGEGGKGGSVGRGAPTGQRQQVGNSGGEPTCRRRRVVYLLLHLHFKRETKGKRVEDEVEENKNRESMVLYTYEAKPPLRGTDPKEAERHQLMLADGG